MGANVRSGGSHVPATIDGTNSSAPGAIDRRDAPTLSRRVSYGEPPGRGVLRPQTLNEIRRPHAAQFGADLQVIERSLKSHHAQALIAHNHKREFAAHDLAPLDGPLQGGVEMAGQFFQRHGHSPGASSATS